MQIMRLSSTTLTIVLAIATNLSFDAQAFKVGGPDTKNNDLMKQSVENALLTEVKPIQDTTGNGLVVEVPPLRNELLGLEVPCKVDYWDRPDIHTFGNVGLGGGFHAAMAPLATKLIDEKAYEGVDVRKNIANELRAKVNKTGARVVDLCCGVGMSTRALESAFHDGELVVGVDTSKEMISMAQAISSHEQAIRSVMSKGIHAIENWFKDEYDLVSEAMSVIDTNPYPSSRTTPTQASYRLANAENTKLPKLSFDLVTVMYGFHEVPMGGRTKIINEARRLLRKGGQLAIVDICPTYEPAKPMLAGEPFVLEYQKHIENQLASLTGFSLSKRKVIVPGHESPRQYVAAHGSVGSPQEPLCVFPSIC